MTRAESHGTSIRSAAFGRFAISEVVMPPSLSLASHIHDAAQLCFVLEGEYLEKWSSSTEQLGPGSLLYRPSGIEHSNRFDEDEVLTLLVSYLEEIPGTKNRAPQTIPAVLFDHLRSDLLHELRRSDGATWQLEGLVLLLGADVGKWFGDRQARPPEWLCEARSIIDARFKEPISLAVIADLVGVHRATLAAAFRHWFHMSVGERIRRRKLEEAIRLLRHSSRSISEISVECGFYDQPHMTRTFARYVGSTPGQVRKDTRSS